MNKSHNHTTFYGFNVDLLGALGGRGNTSQYYHTKEQYDFCRDHYPSIGIYSGGGASHSWLWFVDLFDRFGLYNVHLISEVEIKSGAIEPLDVLCVSGGDTFRIAESLGKEGSETLRAFVKGGGIYIGACAGAYLPLKSSKQPLNLFNYVDTKIANVTKSLPQALRMHHKFSTPYGCEFIFHPVRDAVELSIGDLPPFYNTASVVAPLYGGPPMIPSSQCEVLATYKCFTDRTVFLVDRDLAAKTVINKAAVVRKEMGKGVLYLFGPHFEHPHYGQANKLLLRSIYWETNKRKKGIERTRPFSYQPISNSRDFMSQLKRDLSNSRIVATGLEMLPVYWIIGRKVYEPAKIREFLEAIWKRIHRLEKTENIFLKDLEQEYLQSLGSRLRDLVRELKRSIDEGKDTSELAAVLFADLNRFSSMFCNIYFRTMMAASTMGG